MVNPVAAGFVAGGILARNSGPKAVVGGGLAFAAFSAAIDLFLRRETTECVLSYFLCEPRWLIFPRRAVMIDLDTGRITYSCIIPTPNPPDTPPHSHRISSALPYIESSRLSFHSSEAYHLWPNRTRSGAAHIYELWTTEAWC